MRRLKVLTWHTHGSYLHYLSHAPHEFYVLSRPGRPSGYGGRCGHMPWRDNVHDMPADAARELRHMEALLDDPALARHLGEGARRTARDRFSIGRFSSDWDAALRHVTGLATTRQEPA